LKQDLQDLYQEGIKHPINPEHPVNPVLFVQAAADLQRSAV